MYSVVEKGNTIRIPAESLGGEKSEKITTSLLDCCLHANELLLGNSEGVIYIQTDKLDEFKSKKTGGDDFSVTVDQSFQYGQDNAKTKRFLVFHNKDNKPFQHRFVESTWAKMGGKTLELIKRELGQDANQVGDVTRNYLGDPLRNY
ncbi:hypothetical protein AA0116_g7223 [Alternaria tenuissima]|nr:hypothetical protein AA0116_g7223 [Alternaria tenuissima]